MNCLTKICSKHKLVLAKCPDLLQVATFMKLKLPLKEEEVEFPVHSLKNRLPVIDRTPTLQHASAKQYKHSRDTERMRGQEKVHNKLIYGKYGIQALSGGRMRIAHYEMIRLSVNRNINEKRMFAVWRIGQPWQSVSKKGSGKKMGGGKAAIDHYEYPVKAGRILFEIGGRLEFQEVERVLSILYKKMPFRARIVSQEILDEDERKKQYVKDNNINPFSYKYCLKNNFNGVTIKVSPFELIKDDDN